MKSIMCVILILFFASAAGAEEKIKLIIDIEGKNTKVRNYEVDLDKPLGQLFPVRGKEVDDKSAKSFYHSKNKYTYDYIEYSFGRLLTMFNEVRQNNDLEIGWNIRLCNWVPEDVKVEDGNEIIVPGHYEWKLTPAMDNTDLFEHRVFSFVFPQSHKSDIKYCYASSGD